LFVRSLSRFNAMPSLSRPSRWQRWVLSAVVAAAAALLQWAFQPWLGDKEPYICFLPGIVLVAAVAGRLPAGLVMATGFLSALLWLPPVGAWWVSGSAERLTLLLYLLLGSGLIAFGDWLRRAQQRAADAEARLMTAIEGTGIGVFEIDLQAATAYVSPALARLTGLPVAQVAQPLESWLQHLPPELVAEGRRSIATQLRQGARKYEREVQLPRPTDAPLWLLLRVHVTWVAGRAVRLRGACIDISERKAVETQLAQARAELSQQLADLSQLHELSSRLPEAGTLQQQLQQILQTLAQLHGTRQGLVWLMENGNDAIPSHVHVEASLGFDLRMRPEITAVELGSGASGLACASRERVVIADALADPRFEAFRPLALAHGFRAIHSTPLFGQQGQVLGAISVHLPTAREPSDREKAIADICARKAAVFIERARAQWALDESQGRFRAVLEASAVPFAVLSPVHSSGGQIVDFSWNYINGAAAQALGQGAEQVAGCSVRSLLPQWHDGPAFEHFMQAVAQGCTREFEMLSQLGGPEGWWHCVASPMRDASVAVWFNDITERKRTESLLREADRRKDEFLATLAHELRNPLAPIRQAAQLSNAPGATAEQQRWSREVIDRQVQHMALLLDDLLDVSRITRGVLSLRKTLTELAEVVGSAVETARPAIDQMRHTLRLQLPERPLRFEADPLRVAQVLANLLTNAAKYTPAGGRIDLRALLDGGDVLIEVSDNGIGIEPDSMAEMFRMFSQVHGARGSSTDGAAGLASGLGIGLALSKGLVELHGGSIAASSPGPGQGSTFSVRLPALEAAQAAGVSPQVAHDMPSPNLMPRKVLIADDNRDAADTLAALLGLDGHQTELRFDGDDALAAYSAFDPDVCLFDIGMPGRSGYELARAIRQLPGGQRPLLVAITGWGQESDRQQALEAGFDHHLTKPVNPQQLAAVIARVSRS
jgi:PAS domain S-box-containing protein